MVRKAPNLSGQPWGDMSAAARATAPSSPGRGGTQPSASPVRKLRVFHAEGSTSRQPATDSDCRGQSGWDRNVARERHALSPNGLCERLRVDRTFNGPNAPVSLLHPTSVICERKRVAGGQRVRARIQAKVGRQTPLNRYKRGVAGRRTDVRHVPTADENPCCNSDRPQAIIRSYNQRAAMFIAGRDVRSESQCSPRCR